jgi:predicted unusual protein kinase regulating ubiquinone biosynthesis (AarF/ABC1/UbiB family)
MRLDVESLHIMREITEHWIKDKNLLKLRQMIENPKRYLKTEANYYKLYESTMEQEFWNSKINTKTFSYHEN